MSIKSKLDEHAVNELKAYKKSRTSNEIEDIWRILESQYQCPKSNETEPTIWSYAIFIFGTLLEIDQELEIYDDLPISVNDARKVHIGIRKCIEYGLKPFLLAESIPIHLRLPNIIACTKILLKLINNKFFPVICTRNDQHLVYTDLLSSIFIIICNTDHETKKYFEDKMCELELKISHADYFKILFIIMGSKSGLPLQKIVHTHLMQSLHKPGSFQALCEALLPSITSLDQDEEIVKKRLHSCHVIASIVAQKGHGKAFHQQIVNEIYKHFLTYIRNKNFKQAFYCDVGIRCLSRLYSLQIPFIQRNLSDILFGTIEKLANPCDLLAGAIVCDELEFLEAIHLIHLTFCASGPSDDTLPSQMLTTFIPLFIQIHHVIAEYGNKTLNNEILEIIVRCLSNREKSDLRQIIDWILYEKYDENVKHLHQRVTMKLMNETNEIRNLRFIVTETIENTDSEDLDISKLLQPSISLVDILKKSNHNVLIYNIFLHLLEMLSTTFTSSKNNTNLIEYELNLNQAIEIKFKRKYRVIHSLNELILFKPFHGQFVENPHEIVNTLDKMLYQDFEYIEEYRMKKPGVDLDDEFEEKLTVTLLCIGEFMKRINDTHKEQLMKTLKKLWLELQKIEIKQNMTLNRILKHLNGLLNPNDELTDDSEFQKMKTILSENSAEPYTKVYAIMNMIKLIETNDEETHSNAHILLVLAMKLLKEEDSYIFLNCIKLLISVFNLLNGTVLETLIAEYHFDIESDSADIDFKLKVGEAIVKVVMGLGEMSYKYKDMLISCFLRGVYHQNNEFRTSNMSNLGVILRSLSYQVHHFFQEVSICKFN